MYGKNLVRDSFKEFSGAEGKTVGFHYGWVIVGVAIITGLVNYGIWYSFPVFYINILADTGWSRASTASIFTVGAVVYGTGSLLAGLLIDGIGPRKLFPAACLCLAVGCLLGGGSDRIWEFYLAYVFMGIGVICSGYVPVTVTLSRWFVNRRGTAIGIALMGNVAPPILAYPIQLLITAIGWRLSYVVLGGIVIILIAPLTGFFIRPKTGIDPSQVLSASKTKMFRTSSPARILLPGTSDKDNLQIEQVTRVQQVTSVLVARPFWFLLACIFMLGVGNGIIMNHSIAFFVGKGYSEIESTFAFSVAGLAAVLGRLCGYLADRIGRKVTFSIDAALHVVSVFMLLGLIAGKNIWYLYAFALTFGTGFGLYSPTFSARAADLFSGKNFGKILGLVNIGFGVGQGCGAWIGGRVFDQAGSYDFAIAGTIPVFILMWVFFQTAGAERVSGRSMTMEQPLT